MMNVLSLTLVLTSLVTGAVWSPSPHHNEDLDNRNSRDVIVKEGHRVVVVEYEKEGDGNTKVLISPNEPSGIDVKGTIHAAEEKLSETATAAHGFVEDAKEKVLDGFSAPRELVCDAFGKCKHKISSALGMTKDKVSEKAQEVSDKVSNMEERAKEKAHEYQEHAKEFLGEAVGKSKETVKQATEDLAGTKDKMSDKVSDKAKAVEEKAKGTSIGEALGKAKDSISEALSKKGATEKAKEMVKDTAKKTEHWDVVDSPKRIGEDIERNVTGKVEEGVENVKGQAKQTMKEVGKKSFGEILRRTKEVMYDVIVYMIDPEKVYCVMGLIHMLGFSTAYGMCVWVTFVSSYILGRALPRHQFGMIQSKIYPVYFRAMAYCLGASLLGHSIFQGKRLFSNKMEMFQGFNLLSAFLMVLANLICLEPRATKVMFERMKIEKEEGRGIAGAAKSGIADDAGEAVDRPTGSLAAERQDVLRMNEKLKKLNTYSSALNVSTLVVLTWHMAYMGQRLQASR